ncbi:PTCD3 isoform 3 [Pan troglodytes]|uniref:Pentatricopeptide repeat domain 3 n=2 Tax=Homininae TaxID=207598 RepID=F8WBP9_HUMAN|nr:pentatricopeptide repeat domain 3 [Homo sapiens]KAI4035344.1 pentatricopeptide repeat domain 3 [Homo sapiens]PNI42637.1 PTCD3 isoform 3 [Pan troglodytes]
MAVVSAVRWLGLRSRLGQPLTGRRAGLCEQARSCSSPQERETTPSDTAETFVLPFNASPPFPDFILVVQPSQRLKELM